ncbi:3-hydroxyacyl-ACP dehydratase FabZ family protein [Neorhodopirellula pilleata]|uniref:3-hydroxyacyl-[acyl-carrier-protein] dehydratase FabZ n=1 Tax=Neorhodopirellula pilleata TaxID=2714738 RepID=A0A5C6AVI5_9BACT|nr:3-hydroxyacyl-ACP dehydratase FabZ family protein [Neorhodopirellula pilleata]TWU03983.1 3-hydroxyacyl-[acyl-carrier-protein] dehydratase FabZ [Neorhodopirellula pilleata]
MSTTPENTETSSLSRSFGPEQIEAMIPHRQPMRLLDEVVEMTETTIHARKTFSADDFFVQGHFPGYPLVPGVIQCECCLQAGAILLRDHTPEVGEFVPVATRMDSVKFKSMVRPGDTVDIHVTLKERLSNAFFLSGKMLLGGKTTCRLEFACSITSPRGGDSSDGDQS